MKSKIIIFWLFVLCGCSSQKYAAEGEQCGGFAGLLCKKGFHCIPYDDKIIDGFGKCVADH